MRLWTLPVILLISILPMIDGQFIPLRSGQIVDKLLQYRHFDHHQFLSDAKSLATNPKEILERVLSLLSLRNSTNQCQAELQEILEAAGQKELWALKTLDAWGKPLPSGILKGNSFWLGNYQECVDGLYQPANKSFLTSPIPTQYCMLIYSVIQIFRNNKWFFIFRCFFDAGLNSCWRLSFIYCLRHLRASIL